MTDGSPGGSPQPPASSSATAATTRRRKIRGKGRVGAAPAGAETKEDSKLREVFVKAVSQFPYRISPSIKRRLLTAVDLLEDRPADLAPFLGSSDALDTQLIQDKPLLREWTVELLFQLLTVLAICGLAFAVGITIGSIVCRTTLFSGSAITGLYVETPLGNSTTDIPADRPEVTLLLPRADGWATQPNVTAVLIGRFNLSLPEYSLGSYVEALSAVLTLTYLPAVHIGNTANTCFRNVQPPDPPYVPESSSGAPVAAAAAADSPPSRSGGRNSGDPGNGRAAAAPRQLAATAAGAVDGVAGAGAARAKVASAGTAAGNADARGRETDGGRRVVGDQGTGALPWGEEEKEGEERAKTGSETFSSRKEKGTARGRGTEGAGVQDNPTRIIKEGGGGEVPRQLGESHSSSPSFPPRRVPPLSSIPLSLSPLQRRWRVRSSEFMHRFVAATTEHMRRRSPTGSGARPQPEQVDEATLISTAAGGGPGRRPDAFTSVTSALVRRAIESLSLLSRSSVATRQPLRVPIFDPVTGQNQEQSLMLMRHSAAAGFPLELLEQAATQQGELQPTLLFRSILPFVVGLAHGLNKVQVTASINVPLVAENEKLLEALQKDCGLQRVYFSLEVTLQAVRAMFFKQTHGKRLLEPFQVLCSIRHWADEQDWPPPPPQSFVYDVAELAAEYASLSVGFGSTP